MQTLWDPGTPEFRLQERFVARVKELTGGRLEITLFPPGGLVPTMEKFDAVSKGVFELMSSYAGYWIGKVPELAFTASLPCGFTDAWQYEVWFWEMGGIKLERETWGKHNMYYIAPAIYEQEPMHSKIPIRSIADFKGKKGRFVGMAAPVMAKLGVGVVSLPTADVYPSLEKGIIDFADRGGLAANWGVGLQHVTKYIVLPGFHQPTSVVFYAANMDAWKALTEDLKAILEAACREDSAILFTHIHAENIKALELASGKLRKLLQELYTRNNDDPDLKVNTVKSIYEDLQVREKTEYLANDYIEKAFTQLGKVNVDDNRKKKLISLTSSLISREF